MGDPYLFTSIAAVAIGGASILGGTGSYLGTVAGALVLTILTGVLPIFRLDAGALKIIYGLVILVTVSIAAPPVRDFIERLRSNR
jgi:ribose transport system permease protein